MFLTLITFIVVLSILVFAHELGHFLTAKRFGLIPEEFGFGFPPRAWGIYRAKDGSWRTVKGRQKAEDAAGTVYSVNWLPLGGFVKLGEDDEAASKDANHFSNKPVWQRMIILLAGVSMNMVLAAALLSLGFMIGLPQRTEDLAPNAKVLNPHIQIVDVMAGSPAEEAGLKLGDIIVSVDQQSFTTSEALQDYTAARVDQSVAYIIKSRDEEIVRTIVPRVIEETGRGGIGIGIANVGLVKYPIHAAIWEGTRATGYMFMAILSAFYELLKSAVGESTVKADVAGPVGIAVLTGQVARMGFVYILQFAAMLSINLAIINALPIPALDGGRVLFLIIEKLKGRPVKRELEGRIHYIGFALLMALILTVTLKDLVRLDAFQSIWQAIIG